MIVPPLLWYFNCINGLFSSSQWVGLSSLTGGGNRGNKVHRCTSQIQSRIHTPSITSLSMSLVQHITLYHITNTHLWSQWVLLKKRSNVQHHGQILYSSQQPHQPQSSFCALYPAPLKELQFDGAGHSLPLLSLHLWKS